jgi:phosphatidylinositol alpha-mannosyltransferase
MRILIVSDTYYPHPGGVPEHIYHTSIELLKLGHQVTILAPSINGDENYTYPPVIRIGKGIPVIANRSHSRLAVGIGIQKKVKRVMENGNFEIVHIHGFSPNLPLLALKYSRSKNIATFHAAYDKNLLYKITKRGLMPYFDKIDKKIAVSRVARRSIQMFFPGTYKIIPNGIDINRFNPEIEPIFSLKNGPTILFVGRFEQRKGLKFLIRAFPSIARKVPGARLIIVGRGRLSLKIPESIRNRVIIKTNVSPANVPRYYATGDVFVSPATGNESFGIVLLEAMATGKPIVASDIPGYKCVMEDECEGIFVKKEDPDALSDAIINLLENPQLRETMGERGREKALKYSWNKIVKQIERVYKEVTSNE